MSTQEKTLFPSKKYEIKDNLSIDTRRFLEKFYSLGFDYDELEMLKASSKRSLAFTLVELGARKFQPYLIYNPAEYDTTLSYLMKNKNEIVEISFKSIKTIEDFIKNNPTTYRSQVVLDPQELYRELYSLNDSLNKVTINHLKLQYHIESFARCCRSASALPNDAMVNKLDRLFKNLSTERDNYFASPETRTLEKYFAIYTKDSQVFIADFEKVYGSNSYDRMLLKRIAEKSLDLEVAILTNDLIVGL